MEKKQGDSEKKSDAVRLQFADTDMWSEDGWDVLTEEPLPPAPSVAVPRPSRPPSSNEKHD